MMNQLATMKTVEGRSGGNWLFVILFLFTLGIATPLHADLQDPDALIIRPLSTAIHLKAVDPDSVSTSWVSPWITMLEKSGFGYEIALDNDEFIFNHLNEYDFVILPNVTCLDLSYQNLLNDYLNQGGGLIMTGSFSCRDLSGNWLGCDFLTNYFGAAPQTIQHESDNPIDMVFRRTSPGGLVAGAGFRLHFTPSQTPLQMTPDTTKATVGGYWQDDIDNTLQPAYVYSQLEHIGGRLAWFGLNMSSMNVASLEENRAIGLFSQLFSWASGKGLAKADIYPEGNECAFIINSQVKNSNPDFDSITEQLDDLNIKPVITLFTPLSPAQKTCLAKKTDKDYDLVLDMTKEKSISTDQAKGYIQELLSIGVKLVGISVSDELADSSFLSLAHDYQIPFLMVNSQLANPLLYKPDQRLSTYLLAGASIDFNTLAESLLNTESDTVLNRMVALLEQNQAVGGILRLNVDFNNTNPPAISTILKSIAKYARKNDEIWTTTPSELAERINVWEKIEVSTVDEVDGMKVLVTSRNMDVIKNYTIRVLPQAPLIPEMSMISDLSANCTHSVKNGFFLIDLPKTVNNETFSAKFIPRGGISISANSQGVFSLIFKVAFFVSILFIGAFIWYFTSSKRKPSNILSPDGKEITHPHAHFQLKPQAKEPEKTEKNTDESRPIHRPVLSISPERVFESIPFPEAEDDEDILDDTEIDMGKTNGVLNEQPAPVAQVSEQISSSHVPVVKQPKPDLRIKTPADRMKTFAHLKASEYREVQKRKLAEKFEPPAAADKDQAPHVNSVNGEPASRSSVALDWLKEPESGFTDRDVTTNTQSKHETKPTKKSAPVSADYFRSGASVTAKLPRPESLALSRLKQGEKISVTSSSMRTSANLPKTNKSALPRKKADVDSPSPKPIIEKDAKSSGFRSTAPLPSVDSRDKLSIGSSAEIVQEGNIKTPPSLRNSYAGVTAPLPNTAKTKHSTLPEITTTEKTATRSTAPLPSKEHSPKAGAKPIVSSGARKVTAPLPPKPKAGAPSSTPSPKKPGGKGKKMEVKTSADIIAKSKSANQKTSDWL